MTKCAVLNNNYQSIAKGSNILKHSVVAINVLAISTMMSGVIFEIIGLFSLLWLLVLNSRVNKEKQKRDEKFFASLLGFASIAVVLHFIVQIVILQLTAAQCIRLYGITKTVFAIIIVFFTMRRLIANGLTMNSLLPLIVVMNLFYCLYLLTDIEIFNVFGGSVNYVGAIDLIVFPFALRFDKSNSFFRVLFLLFFSFFMIFSGSRSILLMTVLMFMGMILLEKNKRIKFRYFSLAIILCIVLLVAFAIGNKNALRALEVFVNHADSARDSLGTQAIAQYENYSSIVKMIGSADNIVIYHGQVAHNFVLELLLTYGKIGLVFCSILLIISVIALIKFRPKYWMYILLIVGCVIILNIVQPFITTGYLFQILVCIAIIELYCKRRKMHE